MPPRRWVDDLASNDDGALGAPVGAAPPSNALIAIVELPIGKGKGRASRDEDDVGSVKIGLISVVPSTGDVMWDEFMGMSTPFITLQTVHILTSPLISTQMVLRGPSLRCVPRLIFQDTSRLLCFHRRSQTRITHIQPQEILLPVDKLSPASEKLLEQLLSPTYVPIAHSQPLRAAADVELLQELGGALRADST